MYVTEVVASSRLLATFHCFVLDAGDTLFVWDGEFRSHLEVEMATFFAEHRKSVRNRVPRAPELKFWMLLEECEIDDVCIRNRSASTKLGRHTHGYRIHPVSFAGCTPTNATFPLLAGFVQSAYIPQFRDELYILALS